METKTEQEKFTFFWGGTFSQWCSSNFTIDGVAFNCCEQYMMYKKALLFGDYESAEKIMNTKSPRDQKALGRKVDNYDDEKWVSVCKKIVYDANMAKFTQNEEMLKELMFTGERTIVEASPEDKRWGIGLAGHDPLAQDRATWNGLNWLGEAIELVREELKSEIELGATIESILSNPKN